MLAEGLDTFYHLVQDETLISDIHNKVLPPDEYYDRLKEILYKKYPKARRSFVDHIVAVAAAFDTASAFGLSFGIAKFQLCQPEMKLVGEIVGQDGRRPRII